MRFSRPAQIGALALLVVGVSAPALGGTWVYDDWATAQHPAQSSFRDLASVFARDSSAYMVSSDDVSPVGVTYRPLAMASLIIVQAAAKDAPWLHHLVSLVLHLACTFGLWIVARRFAPPFASLRPWLIAALFALHPLTIEAYAWINGRSDVLACAFLALLACALPLGDLTIPARRTAAIGLAALAAALSKEPAVLCVLGIALAALLPARGLPDRERLRAYARPLAAALLGLASALVLRALVTRGRVSGSLALLADRELLPSLARTLRLAVEHTLVPLPRAMLCLSHELAQPLTLADLLLPFALGALLAFLAWRRLFRHFVLVATAVLTLVPVVAVKQLVWLGFDRYLYMPLFLLCLACAEPVGSELSRSARSLALRASFLLLPLLAAASFASARAYRDHSAWLASLVAARPDDASGYIMSVKWFLHRGDVPRAKLAVSRAPRSGLSPPLSHELVGQLLQLGFAAEAIALSEATYARYPDAPVARFDAMLARSMIRRFREAFELAQSAGDDPLFCPIVRKWLEGWRTQPSLPEAERPTLERTLQRLRCPVR